MIRLRGIVFRPRAAINCEQVEAELLTAQTTISQLNGAVAVANANAATYFQAIVALQAERDGVQTALANANSTVAALRTDLAAAIEQRDALKGDKEALLYSLRNCSLEFFNSFNNSTQGMNYPADATDGWLKVTRWNGGGYTTLGPWAFNAGGSLTPTTISLIGEQPVYMTQTDLWSQFAVWTGSKIVYACGMARLYFTLAKLDALGRAVAHTLSPY